MPENSNAVRMRRLRNGSEEAVGLVTMVTGALDDLLALGRTGREAVRELTLFAHNPDYSISDASKAILEQIHLLKNGRLHGSTKNIVTAAMSDDGLTRVPVLAEPAAGQGDRLAGRPGSEPQR